MFGFIKNYSVSLTLAAASMLAATHALADASARNVVQPRIAYLQGQGGWYEFDLTMHRENTAFVSYARGTLRYDPRVNALTGAAYHLFSDRVANSQPFTFGRKDALEVKLTADGQLHIDDRTWNFSTDRDLAAQGQLLSRYVPGFGIVTLAFREYHRQIQ